MPPLLSLLYPTLPVDKDDQEAIIRASSIPFTIARPMRLDDSKRTDYAVTPTGNACSVGAVSRAATAAFMLDALSTPAYIGQAPGVTYPA